MRAFPPRAARGPRPRPWPAAGSGPRRAPPARAPRRRGCSRVQEPGARTVRHALPSAMTSSPTRPPGSRRPAPSRRQACPGSSSLTDRSSRGPRYPPSSSSRAPSPSGSGRAWAQAPGPPTAGANEARPRQPAVGQVAVRRAGPTTAMTSGPDPTSRPTAAAHAWRSSGMTGSRPVSFPRQQRRRGAYRRAGDHRDRPGPRPRSPGEAPTPPATQVRAAHGKAGAHRGWPRPCPGPDGSVLPDAHGTRGRPATRIPRWWPAFPSAAPRARRSGSRR